MNKLTISRTNGNVPKTSAGQDHISGLLIYSATLPEGFSDSSRIKACSSLETAERMGITAQSTGDILVLYNLLSDIFRINPGISLYVGIFTKPTTGEKYADLKKMQNFTSGSLRQIALYDSATILAQAEIDALQIVANTLEANQTPVSILYYPKVSDVKTITLSPKAGNKNVSVVMAKDGLGIVLGLLSKASVHESIGWVKKFPTGVDAPALSDGKMVRELDRADIEALDAKRVLFFVTYPGMADSYLNDSHTQDVAISDYAMIENVRVMDKACRGVYAALLPELGGSIYVDPTSGKIQPHSIEHQRPVGRGYGNITPDGSITLLRSEVEAIRKASLTGRLQDIAPFDIVVMFIPITGGAIIKHVIRGAQFLEDGMEIKQGDTKNEVTMPLVVASIQWK